ARARRSTRPRMRRCTGGSRQSVEKRADAHARTSTIVFNGMNPSLRTPASRRSAMGTSRLGGVPTTLPDPAPPASLFRPSDLPRARGDAQEVAPGTFLISAWLTDDKQRSLVAQFREWAVPPAGLRHPRVPGGHLMSVQSVCLGWHWQPYAYSRTADDTDGAPVKPMPATIVDLARRAVRDTGFEPHDV